MPRAPTTIQEYVRKCTADGERRRLIEIAAAAVANDPRIGAADRKMIAVVLAGLMPKLAGRPRRDAPRVSPTPRIAAQRRKRLANLIAAAIERGVQSRQIFWTDGHWITRQMLPKIAPAPRGRPVERYSVRYEKWINKPVNRAAAQAAWRVRAWRKWAARHPDGPIPIHRNHVLVNDRWLPINYEAARRTLERSLKLGAKQLPSVDIVAEALATNRDDLKP
jgi:hypothetical protein